MLCILLNLKGRTLYVLVEFTFLAVMGRLAAGKDLTLKVQNTRPRNKFAFRSKLSFHLPACWIQKRALKNCQNCMPLCKITQKYRAGFFRNVDMGKWPGCQFWQTNEHGRLCCANCKHFFSLSPSSKLKLAAKFAKLRKFNFANLAPDFLYLKTRT